MARLVLEGLSDFVVDRCVELAAQRGQSVEAFVESALMEKVLAPTIDDVFARVGQRSGGSIDRDVMLADLAELRDR